MPMEISQTNESNAMWNDKWAMENYTTEADNKKEIGAVDLLWPWISDTSITKQI